MICRLMQQYIYALMNTRIKHLILELKFYQVRLETLCIEFYCTLSVLEVFGVDAIEKMLEDLISVQDKLPVSREVVHDVKKPDSGQRMANEGDVHQGLVDGGRSEIDVLDPIDELRHQQVNRMPGDSVLKILMKKVAQESSNTREAMKPRLGYIKDLHLLSSHQSRMLKMYVMYYLINAYTGEISELGL